MGSSVLIFGSYLPGPMIATAVFRGEKLGPGGIRRIPPCGLCRKITVYLTQHENSMQRGSGSVDKAPDSQWTNASSNLEAHIFDITVKMIRFNLKVEKIVTNHLTVKTLICFRLRRIEQK